MHLWEEEHKQRKGITQDYNKCSGHMAKLTYAYIWRMPKGGSKKNVLTIDK